MGSKRIKKSVLMFLSVVLVAGLPLISLAEEIPAPPKKGTPSEAPSQQKKATLIIGTIVDTKVNIELANTVPVRGVQFTLKGVKITELRTTPRTAGFLAKFNEKTGVIILVSTAADEIVSGTGPIVEVICEKKVLGADLSLSEIMLADSSRKLL